MGNNFFVWLLSLSGNREESLLGKQRFLIFNITAMVIVVLNTITIFVQPLSWVARASAILVFIATIAMVILYYLNKIHLRGGLTTLFILAQLQIVFELVSYSMNYTPAMDKYIISDIFISVLLVMAALISYLRYSPSVVSILSLLSYGFVLFIVDSDLLRGLFLIYLFILVAVIVYDSLAAQTTLMIDEEKLNMMEEFTAFFRATGISRDDIKGYSSLSRNFGASTEQAREILMSMKPWAQHNLVSSVQAILREENSDRTLLGKVFPAFTETQLSIAQLIIQNKKQTEICLRLGKSGSNVSAQRSNIRAKLNLQQDENLREVLINTVEAYKKMKK